MRLGGVASPATATTWSASTSTPTRSRRSTPAAARSSSRVSTSCSRQRVADGRLRATTDTADAIRDTEVSLLCVGTPSRKNGSLDLTLSRARQPSRSARRSRTSTAITSSSCAARCCRARRTTSSFRRSSATSGKNYGDGLRRVGQSRVPARGHRAQGLPQAAADAGRPQPRRRRRAARSRSIRRSTRRSSAPASASPR